MNVLLAIPVYNEAQYLPGVLEEVRRYADNVLVVDDGSTDRTSELLAAVDGVAVIRHAGNMGYGQSLIDAFNYALCHAMDWVITMDCDRQHEPSSIPDFLEAIAEDNADIISGSRYMLQANGDSPPPDRRAINASITCLLNRVLNLGITDAFCGFKAYRVSSLREVKITEPGYAMPLQLWVHAARRGLRIREIPVRLIYNDPKRSFGGPLNDPEVRRRHYQAVLQKALQEDLGALAGCYCRASGDSCCRC
jgi:glycosyltransferase involved in cell wall biosynthesis